MIYILLSLLSPDERRVPRALPDHLANLLYYAMCVGESRIKDN